MLSWDGAVIDSLKRWMAGIMCSQLLLSGRNGYRRVGCNWTEELPVSVKASLEREKMRTKRTVTT